MFALGVSALVLALLSLGPQPDGPDVESASAQQIRDFLAGHGADLRLHALLTAALVPTVLVFAASLAHWPSAGSWVSGGVALAAGAVVVVPPLLDAAVTGMTLVQALDGTPLATVPDTTILTWYAMTNGTHFLGDLWIAPITTMIAAGSLAILSSRALPRWVGFLGIVVAAPPSSASSASPSPSPLWRPSGSSDSSARGVVRRGRCRRAAGGRSRSGAGAQRLPERRGCGSLLGNLERRHTADRQGMQAQAPGQGPRGRSGRTATGGLRRPCARSAPPAPGGGRRAVRSCLAGRLGAA